MSRYQHLVDLTQRTKVEQIVCGIQQAIRNNRLASGSKLPSIRLLAREIQASPFTVSEAYDRLTQDGWLVAKPGSGYFARRKQVSQASVSQKLHELPLDSDWLLSGIFRGEEQGILAGCGWLPPAWYDEDAQARALRKMAREQTGNIGYGHPQGLPALRELLSERLQEQGLPCTAESIILTQGATQGLDLLCRALQIDNSDVLVDNPGYCNLISALRFRGCRLHGVTWTVQGPDLQQLERLMATVRPKVFFTNPWLHNPTGASYAPHIAHGVLRLAQQYGVLIVEDHVSAELMDKPVTTLAALDGLNQVFHVSSFSKAISPALRVGYLLAPLRWQSLITRTKMLAAMTTSSHTEQLALELASDSKYKRNLAKLVIRILHSNSQAREQFTTLRWDVFPTAGNSMFIWAKPPSNKQLDIESARKAQIYLAPGELFSCMAQPTPHYRFNVAYLDKPQFWEWLQEQ